MCSKKRGSSSRLLILALTRGASGRVCVLGGVTVCRVEVLGVQTNLKSYSASWQGLQGHLEFIAQLTVNEILPVLHSETCYPQIHTGSQTKAQETTGQNVAVESQGLYRWRKRLKRACASCLLPREPRTTSRLPVQRAFLAAVLSLDIQNCTPNKSLSLKLPQQLQGQKQNKTKKQVSCVSLKNNGKLFLRWFTHPPKSP